MKLSQTDREALSALTNEQKTRIVFSAPSEGEEAGEVALLLGSDPSCWQERCSAAAELYFAGKVKYIMPTGGVCWEYNGSLRSEADGMREVLLGMGIPDEVILPENEARTTMENMIYCSLQLYRRFHYANIQTVYVVTSPGHLTRSVVLAKHLLPHHLRILGYGGSVYAQIRDHWQERQKSSAFVSGEVFRLRSLIDRGFLEDIEY